MFKKEIEKSIKEMQLKGKEGLRRCKSKREEQRSSSGQLCPRQCFSLHY